MNTVCHAIWGEYTREFAIHDYFLFGSPETKDLYKFHYDAIIMENERSSACIGCGICEEHCPQTFP
jgi:hypothetical protein